MDNFYTQYPAKYDGRFLSNYLNDVDNTIIQELGIKDNDKYRQMLINNGNKIIDCQRYKIVKDIPPNQEIIFDPNTPNDIYGWYTENQKYNQYMNQYHNIFNNMNEQRKNQLMFDSYLQNLEKYR